LYLRYETNIKTVVLVCTLISIVQGFILTLLLIEYFATSKQVILGYLLTSPLLLSVAYYVFIISGISNVVYLFKTKCSSTELDDKNLFQHITRLFGTQNIKLKLFGGKHSFNAFVIPISVLNRKHIKIFVGRDLLNETNLAEILFVIGHEFSHLRDKHGLKKMLLILIYIIILLFVAMVVNYLAMIYSGFSGYLAINLLLIPFGIRDLA